MDIKLRKIENSAPIAYKELLAFVKTEYFGFFEFHKLSIHILPHEFLLGVVIKFFNRNSIEFTVSDTDEEIIFDEMITAFENYEKTISHYS